MGCSLALTILMSSQGLCLSMFSYCMQVTTCSQGAKEYSQFRVVQLSSHNVEQMHLNVTSFMIANSRDNNRSASYGLHELVHTAGGVVTPGLSSVM